MLKQGRGTKLTKHTSMTLWVMIDYSSSELEKTIISILLGNKENKEYYKKVCKDALKWATKNDGKIIFENTLPFILDKLNR